MPFLFSVLKLHLRYMYSWGLGSVRIVWIFALGLNKLFVDVETFILVLEAIFPNICSNFYMAEKGQIKLIFSMLAQYFSWFFFYMAENGHIEVFEYFTLHHILTLYGRKRPYNGGFNRYKSHNLTVLGGVFTCFGTKMGVWNHYMPIFYQKKGGLRVGRGTSKSNRISCVGPIPHWKYYEPDTFHPNKCDELFQWYDEQVSTHFMFDFKNEMTSYCHSDVQLLRISIKNFRVFFNVDPYHHVTITWVALEGVFCKILLTSWNYWGSSLPK